jgi:hypothetical protein
MTTATTQWPPLQMITSIMPQSICLHSTYVNFNRKFLQASMDGQSLGSY